MTRDDVVEAARADRRTGRAHAADRKRGRRRARLAEMRMPADRRRVQVAGARQPAAAADAGGARARRGRLFLGQSRARGRDRREAARHPRDHRHAGRRAAGEDRGHARRRRRNHLLRPAARESREEIAARIADETGATVVPSFDDPAIVAGQGTVGLEIVEQLGRSAAARIVDPVRRRRAGRRDRARRARTPRSSWSSPRAGTTWRRSLELGEIVPVARRRPDHLVRCAADAACLADHLRHPSRAAGAGAVGQRCRSRRGDPLRLGAARAVVEPGGAVALAALLAGKLAAAEDTVVDPVGREHRPGAPRADRRGTRLRRRCASCIRRARRCTGLDRSTALVSSSSSAASVLSSAARKRRSSSATDSEASISVSSIIAMHGRIVSSIRSNASSRRACWSALGMAPMWTNLG